MKTLKQIIKEGLFDNIGVGVTKESIKEWINDNFKVDRIISIKYENNIYIVNANNVRITNPKLTTLTNGHFRWGEVFNFNCYNSNINTLEGAPSHVKSIFRCAMTKITSLKGCENMIVDDAFYCSTCANLKSLEGAPKKCSDFQCIGEKSLTNLKGCENMEVNYFDCQLCDIVSLEGAPEECIEFNCSDCEKLKDFKGAPKKCEKLFKCNRSIKGATISDVLKYCKTPAIYINKSIVNI